MASIRTRPRKDGTASYSVLFTIDGRQTSVTFDDQTTAQRFCDLVDRVGGKRAMVAWEIADVPKQINRTGMHLGEWLQAHIDQLTGCEQKTIDDYTRYRRDIVAVMGDVPLSTITEGDIAQWVKQLESIKNSPKTIRNKHGFLSAALGKAVPEHIPSNPAAGRRLPRGSGDDDEIRMLTQDEYARLLDATTEPWRPLMEFMVVSGARWGEVVALKPGDIDQATGEVKIRRAWKYSSAGYQIGPPKTKRSRRTIRVPARVLDQLDYTGEWLFQNRTGGPVRYVGFRRRVWDKAVERAKLDPAPTPHDLRHTCASWMLTGGVPITVVSRHLGHESIKITVDIYGDVDQASAQLAADFMAGVHPVSAATDIPPAEHREVPPDHPEADSGAGNTAPG
jgi:integrase